MQRMGIAHQKNPRSQDTATSLAAEAMTTAAWELRDRPLKKRLKDKNQVQSTVRITMQRMGIAHQKNPRSQDTATSLAAEAMTTAAWELRDRPEATPAGMRASL
jgi:exopolyphosphatase/pppGpp-phosphohydrolase